MRFDRLRVRNFKPYSDTDLQLTDGVTVIHGLNGSGKSSLLEAAFFALYGSDALDGQLADVVTNDETESDVELWFTHDGESYRVSRELRERGDRIVTATCTLSRDGEVIRDGATAVEAFVAELLRMDASAFVNCAYVKQGEVNKLINASPRERQRIIDDLLQLGKLEEYRDRAGDARLGVDDVLRDHRGQASSLAEQIEQKEAKDLPARLNELESQLREVESDIEEYQTEREKAEQTREEAQSVLDEQEAQRETLREVESTIEEVESDIAETETERERLQTEITEARTWVSDAKSELRGRLADTDIESADEETITARDAEITQQIRSLREARQTARDSQTEAESRATRLRETADGRESTAEQHRQEADRLESAVSDTRSELSELESQLTEIDDRIDRLTARFDDAPTDPEGAADHLAAVETDIETLREERESLKVALQNTRDSIADAEELLAAGNCPECGQPVEGAPNVSSLEADREREQELESELATLDERAETLLDRRSAAESLVETADDLTAARERRELVAERVEDKREQITQRERRIETLREDAETADREAADKREAAAEADEDASEAAARIEEIDAEIESAEATRDRLDEIASLRDRIEDREDTIERLTDRRGELADRNDERRDRLADLETRRAELAEAVDEQRLQTARESLERAETYIQQVDEELARLDTKRGELQGTIGGVKNELSELDDLREQHEQLTTRVETLEAIHEETADLETMYGELRAELRRKNVSELERTLNETFELVYGNDAYSHIELDGDYGLTVYQKDGAPLEPAQLSGGERALFNLSLRCGIYRLLTEGIEGSAPTPPLILDEPTVFLDDGHVGRLVSLISEMRGFGVRQIIIVSHDDELVGAADELVHVQKNPTTNRSRARRMDDPSLSALGTADD